jgi:hypothetical protein
MNDKIKSGKETLDEFFAGIKGKEELGQTGDIIAELYKEGKLTDKNLTNALSELREAQVNDKD